MIGPEPSRAWGLGIGHLAFRAVSDRPPAAPAGPALRAAGLSHSYGDLPVLRALDLELPAAGSIAVGGHELPREAWRLRGRIGYLGHQPLLYRDLGARENLDFHGKLFGLDGAGAERADELLDRVGLAHRAATRVD